MSAEPEKTKKPYYTIASLEKGLKIIELLSVEKALSVTEVANRLGQNRSASHRFLATLKDMGYVIQDDNSRYKLSLKMFEIGNKIANIAEIRPIARPHIEELANLYQETVNLGHLEGQTVVTIDMVSGKEVIKYDSPIGNKSLAHTLAMGKAMIAFWPREKQVAYLETAEFPELTPKSITSRTQFEKELDKIKAQGFAIDDEEWTPGLRCVAVPVFDHTSTPSYAISVSGPAQRMTDEKLNQIQKNLRNVGKALSRELGSNRF